MNPEPTIPKKFSISVNIGETTLIELLKTIWEVIVALFTEWIPIYQSADLGVIGTVLGIISLVSLGTYLIKRIK